jgi:hypothetical protein
METKMTKVTLTILEVASGEVRLRFHDIEDKYADNQRFYYEDGNGSCDCNRKIEFGLGGGVEFLDEETPCGSVGYKVRVRVGDDVVYDEINSEKAYRLRLKFLEK